MLATWIAIGVIAMVVAGAVIKIVRDKRSGVKCIGCPYAQRCSQSGNTAECCSHMPGEGD